MLDFADALLDAGFPLIHSMAAHQAGFWIKIEVTSIPRSQKAVPVKIRLFVTFGGGDWI